MKIFKKYPKNKHITEINFKQKKRQNDNFFYTSKYLHDYCSYYKTSTPHYLHWVKLCIVMLLLIMQPTCSKLVRSVHTHEAWRVGLVSPNLPINQNMSLHQNGNDLTVCEGILQPVPQNKDQWQALPGFVGARWWLRSLHRELENIIHTGRTTKNKGNKVENI